MQSLFFRCIGLHFSSVNNFYNSSMGLENVCYPYIVDGFQVIPVMVGRLLDLGHSENVSIKYSTEH